MKDTYTIGTRVMVTRGEFKGHIATISGPLEPFALGGCDVPKVYRCTRDNNTLIWESSESLIEVVS